MDGMDHIIIETPRLLLREMAFSDMQDLSLILQDERVMYAYNVAFSDEETEIWMRRQIQRYADFGFGLWAMVLKSAGKMIGQCGITMQGYKNLQVPEIGYLLAYDFGIVDMPRRLPWLVRTTDSAFCVLMPYIR